jgi:hypothetical protein
VESQGLCLPVEEQTAEQIAVNWSRIADTSAEQAMASGTEHLKKMLTMAATGLRIG